MTQEDKQLLIKDLCARLPYGTMVHISNPAYSTSSDEELTIWTIDNISFSGSVKPYLRLMSSMTEEEVKELVSLGKTSFCTLEPGRFREIANPEQIDWLNANHFNYRLPAHLFIEAPEGMYK